MEELTEEELQKGVDLLKKRLSEGMFDSLKKGRPTEPWNDEAVNFGGIKVELDLSKVDWSGFPEFARMMDEYLIRLYSGEDKWKD